MSFQLRKGLCRVGLATVQTPRCGSRITCVAIPFLCTGSWNLECTHPLLAVSTHALKAVQDVALCILHDLLQAAHTRVNAAGGGTIPFWWRREC